MEKLETIVFNIFRISSLGLILITIVMYIAFVVVLLWYILSGTAIEHLNIIMQWISER